MDKTKAKFDPEAYKPGEDVTHLFERPDEPAGFTISVDLDRDSAKALFALAPSPLALGLVTAACFGITPIAGVAQYTYRLATIPNELQGRVNSVFRLLIFAGQPVGLLLAGLLLQGGRATVAVAVFTALLCLVALAATLDSRVRHAGMLAAMGEDV